MATATAPTTGKFHCWRKELRGLIANPIISRAALESLIEKLVHTAYVISLSRDFLSCFQYCLTSMKENIIEYALIIQGGNRRCNALGRTAGASAPRHLYE